MPKGLTLTVHQLSKLKVMVRESQAWSDGSELLRVMVPPPHLQPNLKVKLWGGEKMGVGKEAEDGPGCSRREEAR